MTSLVSSEVTVAGEETPPEAPPTTTAPEEGIPWGFLAVLGGLTILLFLTRRKKEEERGR
jgi:hypothetical protein